LRGGKLDSLWVIAYIFPSQVLAIVMMLAAF
jgi:hypothetical protein